MEEKLIVAVCGHPVLYDTTAVFYRDKIKKEEAWVKVGEELGLPEEKRTLTPGPSTGAVIGGIAGSLVFIGLIIGIIFFIRKRQEDAEGPPKHKPPPPVKAGSSTEMLNKPSEPPTATETAPLSPGEVYYEPTGGEPVTNLDDETTGALNGGGPGVLGDPAKYDHVNELKDHVADGHHGNEAPAANISRGESFVSPAMYV